MTNKTEHYSSKKDFWRILPGIIISLIFLTIVMIVIDWEEVLHALREANYIFILMAVPIYVISYMFRTMAWRILLQNEVSFKRTFLTLNIGYLLNNVLPFRMGEIGRAVILGRSGLGFWRVLSTILIERAFDMVIAVGILLMSLPFVVGAQQSTQTAYYIGFIVIVGMFTLYFLARYQEWALRQYETISNRWPLVARIGKDKIQSFFTGLDALVDFSKFLRVFIWMVTSWFLAILFQHLLLRAFVPEAEILWVVFGIGATAMGIAVPSSPSYIGVYEAAWIGALSLFGVSASVSLAYALFGHTLHVVLTGVLGVYGLAKEGQTLGELFSRVREQKLKGNLDHE